MASGEDRPRTGPPVPEAVEEDGPIVIDGRELRPGDPLGPYLFEQEIGSGGMARVLLARTPDGQRLALKLLRPGRSAQGLARFRREFHALKRLHHPNIVAVHAWGELGEHPYIAMEYVDGPDLHAVIRDLRTVDDAARWRRCEAILVDLCRALGALHRRGLVHRDLKPSNILLTQGGEAKLTDFGIVKDLDAGADPDVSTTLVGTWAYASPEHITGQAVDHRSDLYSLGVILFAMLTGKRPFNADSMAGWLDAHLHRPAPRASRVRPGVPPHLDALCDKLLAKAPRDRFQSAREVLYRLEAGDPEDDRLEGQETWEPPLVGQRDAIDAIEEAVSALVGGRGGVVRVLGDDGLGRTRMLQVAIDRARELGLPFHLHTFHHHAAPWDTLMAVARDLARELPEEAGDGLRDLLRVWTEHTLPRADLRYAVTAALGDALEHLLAERPRVILLDDLHVAPAVKGEVLRSLARRLLDAGLPVLFVLTGRPGSEVAAPSWREGLPVTDLTLQPLAEEDVVAAIAALLGPGRASAMLGRRLHQESEGSASFVAEFLRSLMAQGLLTRSERGWKLALDPSDLAQGAIEVPPSIRAILRRRVAQVPQGDREVLEVLAIGTWPCPTEVLADALDLDEEPLLQRLDRLLVAGLVHHEADPESPRYGLAHGKLGEVLKLDIPPARAAALHRALAVALEATRRHDPAMEEAIGVHYQAAGDAARAFTHLVEATVRLVERDLPQEALRLGQAAREMESSARDTLDEASWSRLRQRLLGARAEALRHRAAWEEAIAVYRDLVDATAEPLDEHAACDARVGMSQCLRRLGRFEEAEAEAQAALTTARRLPHRRGVAEAQFALAGNAWSRGQLSACESHASEGLLVAHGTDLAAVRAQLLIARSAVQTLTGQLVRAEQSATEAEALLNQLRMEPTRAQALVHLAELLAWQGQTEVAVTRAEEAMVLARRLDTRHTLILAQRVLGTCLTDLGRTWEAYDVLREALHLAQEVGAREEALGASTALVRLCVEQGDSASALKHAAAALATPPDLDPERWGPWLEALVARLLAPTRRGEAKRTLERAEATLPHLHAPRRQQVRIAAAAAHRALGSTPDALRLLGDLLADPAARPFKLLQIEARAMLVHLTSGEESARHRKLGSELVRDYADGLGVGTAEEVRRRAQLRGLG